MKTRTTGLIFATHASVLAAFLGLVTSGAWAALDPSFGQRGMTRLYVSVPNCAGAFAGIVRDHRGSLVGAGTGRRLFVARWTAGGRLHRARSYECTDDPQVRGVPLEPAALVRRADGGLVAVGRAARYTGSGGFSSTFSVGIFRSDLRLSSSFAQGGVTTPDVPGDREGARAVALAPGGAVIAAGYARLDGQWRWALVRVAAAGGLDPAFADSGVAVVAFPGTNDPARVGPGHPPPRTAINALRRLEDGRLIAAGTVVDSRTRRPVAAVARFSPDGRLDTAFGGGDGFATVAGLGESRGLALVLQGSGESVVVGGARGDPGQHRAQFFAARLTRDGRLDTTFGRRGIVTLPGRGGGATDISLAAGRKIVLSGWVAGRLAVTRLYPNGRFDPGIGGAAVCAPRRYGVGGGGAHPETDRVSLAVTPSGKPVAAAAFDGPGSDDVTWVLARFKAAASSGACPR